MHRRQSKRSSHAARAAGDAERKESERPPDDTEVELESRKRKRQPVRFAAQPEVKQDSEQEDEDDEEFRPDDDDDDDDDDVDAQEESPAEEPEEESPISVSAAAFMAVGGPMMANLMQEDGPIVSVVVLRADGSTEEKKIDMTPKLNSIPRLLGGKATFVGQWRSLDVVLMSLRHPSEETPRSAHKLPPPFQDDVVQGDVVLIRMDENSMPTDFTLAEYNEFVTRSVSADASSSSPSASSFSSNGHEAKKRSKKSSTK